MAPISNQSPDPGSDQSRCRLYTLRVLRRVNIVKNLIGYLMIGAVKLMGLVSFSRAQKVGRYLGKRLASKRTRSREVARVNLNLCYPDKSKDFREAPNGEVVRGCRETVIAQGQCRSVQNDI